MLQQTDPGLITQQSGDIIAFYNAVSSLLSLSLFCLYCLAWLSVPPQGLHLAAEALLALACIWLLLWWPSSVAIRTAVLEASRLNVSSPLTKPQCGWVNGVPATKRPLLTISHTMLWSFHHTVPTLLECCMLLCLVPLCRCLSLQ